MHWGDMGWGWGGMLVWIGFMLLLFGVLAAVLVALLRRPGEQRPPGPEPQRPPGPEQILAERFARGEIDEDEYRRRREVLGG